MKRSQIAYILSKFGYSFDKDILLSEISSITLTNEACLYPGKTNCFKFDGSENILYVYEGHTDKNGKFVKHGSLPSTIISCDIIEAINMKGTKHIEAPYREGRTV